MAVFFHFLPVGLHSTQAKLLNKCSYTSEWATFSTSYIHSEVFIFIKSSSWIENLFNPLNLR